MTSTNNLLNKGCRTCLNAVKGWKPLSTKTRDYKKCLKSYAELLEEVTKINIKDAKYRKLPQLICGNCSRLLKSAYAFIQQAVEVQEKLCSTLNDEKLYSLPEMKPCKEIKIEKNEQKLNMENEDCLQETEIDIESCMETQVYIKSGGNTEDQVRRKDRKNDTKEIQTEKKSSTFELLKCTTKSQVESNKLDEYESELALSDSSECKETKTKKLSNTKLIKNKKSSLTSEIKLSEQNEGFLDVAVPCNNCNKIFKNSKLLAVHQKISHVPEERKCTCHLCGKKFTRYCNMYKHMRTFHGPETVILVSKRPESDYIYNCDKCPKKYSRKKSLVYHKKLKHSPVKVVIETREEERKSIDKGSLCPICGSSFTSKNQLTVHLRRHTGEKPFKCNLCDRAFLLVTQLNSHKRLHTGEKPYKCKMCGKAFRVSDDLRQHMRTHTNIRSHKCNQCERSFKYPQDLKIHLRSHTGERPYTCADCGDSFQRYNALRLHRIRIGHLENLLQNTKKI